MKTRNGSVLVGILWCLALLSVVVVGVLHSARLDLMVVKNHGDRIQAHYLALAGVEKAKALLYRDLKDRQRSAKDHNGGMDNLPAEFKDVSLGRGQFSVIHQGRRDEGGGILYGVTDEESRLNVNRATADELRRIQDMPPEAVAGIVDWRDSDNQVTPGGAETEFYVSQASPRLPRNGPFQTIRELLMVNGVSREFFMGEDANQNGLLDPEEDDGTDSNPPDNRDGVLDAGLSGMFTVDSAVRNLTAAGQERVNVQSADEKQLSSVPGITADLAKAMVAYRGQNQFENLMDFLEVSAVPPQGQATPSPRPPQSQPTAPPPNRAAPPNPRGARTSPANPQGAARAEGPAGGPKLISDELLMQIADDITVATEDQQPGAVNINTASVEVLMCLPGITRELAQAIVAYRKSAGFFPNIAWLLKVEGMNRSILKQVCPKVCARSETFRVLSEGRVHSSGARKRIQVIVRVTASSIDTISYREDL